MTGSTEVDFDFEEAMLFCDKNISMMYYDEAIMNRNFIIKIRKLIKLNNLTSDEFRIEVGRLHSKLKIRQQKFLQKHLGLLLPQSGE